MSNFWINLYKFPRFLISVLIGFFLTTFQPIFKLLKNKKERIVFMTIIVIITVLCYRIIQIMTDNI
uniref:hypothetical protein n=1 Tax=Symphyocladia marchantioides TaxID=88360 RepID=UPI0022FD5E79|nr:hypothetical protein PNW48_pgp026 [Symphyocladia marchantioides]WAX03945.1 hypothetical protein [Symphyocladia marchantioides]